jgi:hypothetical protein
MENPAEPFIAPQLTAGETSAAKHEAEQSLEAADRNLAKTRGRTLDASRTDLVSKIREFMDDAREAMRNGDWTRARNLAKKAEVLSSELSRSL